MDDIDFGFALVYIFIIGLMLFIIGLMLIVLYPKDTVNLLTLTNGSKIMCDKQYTSFNDGTLSCNNILYAQTAWVNSVQLNKTVTDVVSYQ